MTNRTYKITVVFARCREDLTGTVEACDIATAVARFMQERVTPQIEERQIVKVHWEVKPS